MSPTLFSFPPVGKYAAPISREPIINYGLPALVNTRIEFYNNGNRPPKGRTQFGLVFDINSSEERFHVNYLNQNSGYDAFKQALSSNVQYSSKDEKHQAKRILDAFDELDLTGYHAYIGFGKRNTNPGKKDYKLVPNYKVWTILVPAVNDDPPWLLVHWGDETHIIAGDHWYEPNAGAYYTCRYNARVHSPYR